MPSIGSEDADLSDSDLVCRARENPTRSRMWQYGPESARRSARANTLCARSLDSLAGGGSYLYSKYVGRPCPRHNSLDGACEGSYNTANACVPALARPEVSITPSIRSGHCNTSSAEFYRVPRINFVFRAKSAMWLADSVRAEISRRRTIGKRRLESY